MKKAIFLIPLLMAAVCTFAQPTVNLKKVLELKMPKTVDDDMPGTRGGSVAWHPLKKKYYAVFAGNMSYPLAVFDDKGKRLSNEDQTAMIDTRGIWYNASTKQVEGNGYNDGGWFSYQLDAGGLVTDITTISSGMNQPDAQTVGTYLNASKQVLFLKGGMVYKYNTSQEMVDSVAIHWGRKKSEGPGYDEDTQMTPEDYNYTSLICTGIKGQEIGFLNVITKTVELYDIKTGYLAKKLAFPKTATAEMSFNFAYANGIYWLFDMENRVWIGYK